MTKQTFEGIVLKAINYKDSDKIYTIFTKSLGKISASGKGVRKINSKRSGSMDTLNLINFATTDSKNGQKILTEVQIINSFFSLKADLNLLFKAYVAAELVKGAVEDNSENVALYKLIKDFLVNLEGGEYSADYLLLKFKISFLEILGYSLTLNRCLACERKDVHTWDKHFFDKSQGGLICGNDIKIGLSVLDKKAALALFICDLKGYTKKDLERLDFKAANNIIDDFIKEHLYIEIKSDKLLNLE